MKTLPPDAAGIVRTNALRRTGKARLGKLLLMQGVISVEQLQKVLEQQKLTGKRIGRLLIDTGILSEELLAQALARQLGIAFVDLKAFPFRSALVQLLPESAARRYRALVLQELPDSLLVALGDPLDLSASDELSRLLKRPIAIAAVAEGQLAASIDLLYRRTEEITNLARELEQDTDEAVVDFGQLTVAVGTQGAPVVRLLQSLFEDAMHVGASDVHIEPRETALQIRLRIDGTLQTQMQADKRIGVPLVQRLKVMAGLDISEKRLPQDGRFSVGLKNHIIDVRLSTLPTTHGEAVVMRLLDQRTGTRRLEGIGMPPPILERFREVMGRSVGMVLVAGPTGSGKTTTLYAALAEIDVAQFKVITVEDPVEYRLPGITQVQVNDKIELTFARVLRATLRQDPDVILVGEMRDAETAEVGLRAAITGHLVLSTLHTRDAASTPFRLLDMGVPPYMVATSLQAVIAQRLVRLNCPECAQPHVPNVQEQAWLSAMGVSDAALSPLSGAGCSMCHSTGYAGRRGVYELLVMDAVLTEAILHADPVSFSSAARSQMRGRTVAHQTLELVRQGRTSLAEALRVGFDVGDEDHA